MRYAVLFTLVMVCLPAVCQDCSRTIAIDVVDLRTGKFISSLQPETLQARLGDRQLPLTDLKRIEKSRILVLIDGSASMQDPSEGRSYKNPYARSEFLKRLNGVVREVPERASVGYGVFAKVQVFTPSFAADAATLGKNIDDLLARTQPPRILGKQTAIFDALHEALKVFDNPQPGDSILLVTDGGDNRSQLSSGKLEEEFAATGVRLFTILIMTPDPLEEVFAADPLVSLSNRTGGSGMIINLYGDHWADANKERTISLLRTFWLNVVGNGYAATIPIPADLKKKKTWKLQLNKSADPRLKDALLLYPTQLYPCKNANAALH